MAGTHETYSLGINVNYDSVNKAEHALGAVYSSLGKIGERADRLHMPSALPKEINHIDTVTASYIQRLESEGKTYQANQQKVKAYQSAVAELSNKQESLQNDLTKIAESSGKASDAYRLQKIRINETATELSHFKSGIQATQAELKNSNPTFFDKIKSKLAGVNHEAKDTHTTLKDMFMGSALGGMAVNALSSVTSKIGGAVQQGMQLNTAVAKTNSRFQAMGMSAKQVKALDSQIGELRANTTMTVGDVADLQTRMLNWSTIGTKGAMQMAKTIAGIGDSSKLNSDQVEQLSGELMRVGAAGKVTAGSLSRISRNAPTLYATLAKGAGMSESKLKSLLGTGKVTQKQFQTWMAQASKYSGTAFKSFGKTQTGAMQYVKIKWQDLSKEMTKPLFDAKSSGLQSLKGILTSKELTNGAKAIGNGIAAGVKYLDENKKDISATLVDLVHISVLLGKDLWHDVGAIIGDIGRSFGLIHGNAAKSANPLHTIRLAFDGLARNKTAIQLISKAVIAMAMAKGLKTVGGGILNIGLSAYQGHKNIKAFKAGLDGIRDAKKFTGAEDAFNSLGKAMSNPLSKLKDFSSGTGGKIFGAVGTALVAGGQVVNAVKDRHNAENRSKDIGGAVGAVAGGALTSMIPVVGPLLAPIGAEVGKYAGRWGGHAVNQFTKGWQRNKPPKSFWSLQNLGWSTHTFLKNLGPSLKKGKSMVEDWATKTGESIHKGWDKGIRTSHKFFKDLPSNINKLNQNKYVIAFKNGALISYAAGQAWRKSKRFRTKFGTAWNDMWQKDVLNNRYVKAFEKGKFFSTAISDIESRWSKFSSSFGKKWSSFWNDLSNTKDKVMNNVKAFGNDIAYAFGGSKHTFKYKNVKSHASGGLISTNHGALVGEAGPELAYKPYGNARILGVRGPEITTVRSGERILNARDTARVMSGGLGNGLILKGYARGTISLAKSSKKIIESYKDTTEKSAKTLSDFSKTSKTTWSKITTQTGKETDKTRKTSIDDYTAMHKGIRKQMTGMHDNTIKLAATTAKGFGKELDRMKGYARDAMSDMIDQINKGIKGIDKVLGQFGGNTSVIKPVRFAKGTDANGRLTRSTFAMVNDASEGPRQEALISDKNEIYLPRGRNVLTMIPKGWGVLNGSQTQQAGLTHFAKGSGMSHSELKELAEKSGRDSAKSFHDMYTVNVQVKQPDIQAGMTDLAKNASTKLGNAWSNAMWTVINNAIEGGSGGSARGLLKAVEDYGEGHKYVWGAAGPSAFDCSGLVMYALNKKYGIDYPHYSASQYAMTEHISKADAKMGDLVFWGPGHHVGVYAGGNEYFSAQSPSQGIHMSALSSVQGEGSPMFGRVKGLKQDTGSSKKTASKSLMALAKQELGSSALKWIKNNLGDEVGSMGNPAGDGVNIWSKVIKKAASAMHVSLAAGDLSQILSVIEHESGGNPTITNTWDSNAKAGTPSKGLIQFIDPTFQHYAMKGHRNILNGYDQLLAMFNDSTWRQDLTLGGWGPTGAKRYAKGGKPAIHTPFIAGENGPELITTDGPVKVDTHETTKRKVQDLANLIKFPKISRPTNSHKTSQAPTINININGPISSEKDAMKYARMIKDEVGRLLAQFAENVGDEFGADPSVY